MRPSDTNQPAADFPGPTTHGAFLLQIIEVLRFPLHVSKGLVGRHVFASSYLLKWENNHFNLQWRAICILVISIQ
jgi:hypothetical protein